MCPKFLFAHWPSSTVVILKGVVPVHQRVEGMIFFVVVVVAHMVYHSRRALDCMTKDLMYEDC